MKRLFALTTCFVILTGCLPILVGGMIWKSSKSREEHERWSTQFQATNIERVKIGLPPLDWCIEATRFDKGWAHQDTNCAARIDRAEAGDSTALRYMAPVPSQ